jgi:hypothetical protein
MRHESPGAERLALMWHMFGTIVSLFWCFAGVAGAISLEPLIHAPGQIGTIFFAFYFFAILSSFIAGAGAAWHLWAAREHRKVIRG